MRKTLYIRRDVLNAQKLIDWAKGQGFETTLPASDMHVTQMYSKTPVDWDACKDWYRAGEGVSVVGGSRVVSPLGSEGAVVLKIEESYLSDRHEELMAEGCSWDYDEYHPHVTISYNAGDLDLSKVVPFEGVIKLGPEKFEEVKRSWADDITEKGDLPGHEFRGNQHTQNTGARLKELKDGERLKFGSGDRERHVIRKPNGKLRVERPAMGGAAAHGLDDASPGDVVRYLASNGLIQKGDFDGHPFRSNQHTDGPGGDSIPDRDSDVTDDYINSLPVNIRDEDKASTTFQSRLRMMALDNGGYVEMFHESPGDVAASMRSKGIHGGDSGDGVFAAIGEPSNYVTTDTKTVVRFRVPKSELEYVSPDMSYGGLTRVGPHMELLIRFPKLKGAYVGLPGKVPSKWIADVKVISKGKATKMWVQKDDPGGDSVHVDAPLGPKKKKNALAKLFSSVGELLKGDFDGHPFRGNQHGGGGGGGLKSGARVRYFGWGDEKGVMGTLVDDGKEHKDRVAYGVRLDNGEEKWGYTDQFEIEKADRKCPECKDAYLDEEGVCKEHCGYEGDMSKAFNLTAEFTKIDEDKRLVTGWASVITENGEHVIDSQEDVITEEELVKAAHQFMQDARVAKEMHEGGQIGDVVESLVMTTALQKQLGIDLGKVGWIITMKINDDEVWKRVKDGELRAFSIGGQGVREPIAAE